MSKQFKITVIYKDEEIVIKGTEGQSILAALRAADISEPESPCGGGGTCGKCTGEVTGSVAKSDGTGVKRVVGEMMKLCVACPADDCKVKIGGRDELKVVTDGTGEIEAGGKGLGLAVDIGTTTVAAYIYDLEKGVQISTCGIRNSQSVYGADVISRITNCADGGLQKMEKLIGSQLKEMAKIMCEETGHQMSEITKVSIAGNTVMQHLFMGLDPTSIGVTPFTPLSYFGKTEEFPSFTEAFAEGCELWLAPAIAGYVGGDITAGYAACMDDIGDDYVLYIDVGTNGEMLIGDKNGYISCATAAGPAFEGALIDCGTGAREGAIDVVNAVDGELVIHTICNEKANGICGSGLIDAVAAMLELGIIDETGRLLPPDEAPEHFKDRLKQREDRIWCFYLQEDVYISAADIRKLQLAKAAIRAGAETLMQISKKSAGDIDRLIIAGGFGSHMKVKSALAIGLLPQLPPERISHVGNAAGAGAAMALTQSGRDKVNAFAKQCGYLELSGSPEFQDNYIDCMIFDEEE